VRLRELPWIAGTRYENGASYVLLAFFLTWSCDTGAYAFGRLFGRNRPWASISPRKSLEGSIGGLIAAIAAGFIARAWFAPYLGLWDAPVLGLLVGICGQVGDLVESLLGVMRRRRLLGLNPGHGGILDPSSSLCFGAPLVFYPEAVVFRVP
jgi:phosphatidate cytidylyltransferase